MLLLGKIDKKHPGDLPLMVADLPPTPVLFGKKWPTDANSNCAEICQKQKGIQAIVHACVIALIMLLCM